MKKYTWPSALLLSLVLSLGGCGKPSAEAQLQKAREYAAKGEKKAAIIEFKNLLADYPENADARRQLGQLYLESGETDAALIELKKAVEHGADKVGTASTLARALLAKGDHLKALEYLDPKKMPEADTAPALIVLRGHAFAMRGMFDDATRLYQAALKIDPKYADASIGLARVAVMQRQPEQAMTLLDGVLAHSPSSVDALLMKGDLLRRKGERDAAIQLYERALAADKGKDQAYLSLIAMAIEADQLPKARAYLTDLQKVSANNLYARHLEAVILLREKQPDQALAKILEVLKLAPALPASNLLAANIEYSKGMYQQAIAHLNAVLANSPNNLPAQRLMVATLLKQNEADKAAELLNKLTEQYPDDTALLSLAGEAAVRKRDYAKAMSAYSRAAQLDPKSVELRTKVAMARMATGDADKALHDLENIAAGDDKATQADIVLVLAHINKREWQQAETVVARLASKQDDSPLIGGLRASILLGKNDVAGARKQLDMVLDKYPGFVSAAVNLARLDLQEKKPEQAQKRFEALLAKEPKNLGLMMAYAEFLLAVNKPAEAQPWLDSAHQLQPEALEPSLALTGLAMRNKDFKRAQAIAQEALARKPDNPQLLDNLASVQLAAGEQNQALATLAKLVKAVPNSPLAYLKMANAQMLSGNNPGAIESLQKAISLAPNAADAYVLLSRLYLRNKQPADAMKAAQTLQRLQPKNAAGYLLEGDVHMQAKAGAEAAAAYQRANAIESTSVGMIGRHRALVLSGKGTQADEEIADWVTKNTNDIGVRTYLAENALLTRNFTKAVSLYEALVKLQGDNPSYLNNLAYSYHQIKDPRAMSIAEQAVKLAGKNAAILDTYALILDSQGKLQNAERTLKQASELSEDPEVHFHYAQVLIKNGKSNDAKLLLERLLQRNGEFPDRNNAVVLLNRLRKG